ncbi:MAG: M23 family metallopeptidase [Clostridia bacterium]|jgi:murein DD-endopeptidase MepM/ murein hydrolase activator NlpD|nr:M23 family metallopeptidase [Clostridia bacterium]
MRRENRKRVSEEGLDTKKMLYVTGSVLALAVIIFVIAFLLYSNKLNNSTKISKFDTNSIGNLERAEETSTPYGKTVNEMKNESETNTLNNTVANNTVENTTSSNNEKIAVNTSSAEAKKTENTTTNSVKEEEKKNEKVPDPEFKKPVKGDIIKEFADNKLVYSSTLDVWATHDGIDIAAEKTSVVKAAADGKVSSIKNDPRYGLTVTIEHINGYKTVYANLLSTEFVVEGENVKQGQSIGTIGNTAAFEISDEPHLHFELLKENEQQDPELYLK